MFGKKSKEIAELKKQVESLSKENALLSADKAGLKADIDELNKALKSAIAKKASKKQKN